MDSPPNLLSPLFFIGNKQTQMQFISFNLCIGEAKWKDKGQMEDKSAG